MLLSAVEDELSPLYVSKPLLPSIVDLARQLESIWESQRVTNHGPLSLELEKKLSCILEVPTAMVVNNGTTGLLIALRLFDLPLGSEVITTPLTFAATAHSIVWNGLKPIFVDVSEDSLTIDPRATEAAISHNTSAILGVHAYGCVCDHVALQEIATKNNIKLIYDAAHAFTSTWRGLSVASLGDASVFSFHATKLFNTIEGGAIATPNLDDQKKIYLLRNFGIHSEDEVTTIGVNGKLNEVQSAIGLLNLDLFQEEKKSRGELREKYRQALLGLPGLRIQEVASDVSQSEQYFLIRIDSKMFGRTRDQIKQQLESQNIFCRKYFFPLCTDFEPYKHLRIISNSERVIAEVAKDQVLCLPFHSGVSEAHIDRLTRVFRAQN